MSPGTRRAGAAVALSGALLAGCETAPVQRIEDAIQDIQFRQRTRGERQLADADAVSRELQCHARSGPRARLDTHEVLPVRPTPGREINHRIVYTACGLGSPPLTGTIVRRVSFRGRVLLEDSDQFTMRSGRWAIDAFIGIPPRAEPGLYRVEVRIERRGVMLRGTDEFTVVAR